VGAYVDDELPGAALADVSPHEVLLDRMRGELTPDEEAGTGGFRIRCPIQD
jgi:hypothetical protein